MLFYDLRIHLGTGVEGRADFPPPKAPEITRRPAFNAGPGVAEKLYKSYPNVAFLNGHTDREEMFGCHGSRRDAAACRVSTSRLPRFYSSRYPGKKSPCLSRTFYNYNVAIVKG
ncbi:hypothetical protein CDAR_19811 [Caerostris darwini]|uniref:Uncharacterized protein n=1 Tax=Caerostris darwini TaxID=1538125 RepID=A0AAV4U967_9ARAC|nr:hypothetical protein CDAR_19811 [Caerostris darwini]